MGPSTLCSDLITLHSISYYFFIFEKQVFLGFLQDAHAGRCRIYNGQTSWWWHHWAFLWCLCENTLGIYK